MNEFWVFQPFREFLLTISIALTLALWTLFHYCPSLSLEIIRAYQYKRYESLANYISRFLPLYWFRLIILGVNTLSLSGVILALCVRLGHIQVIHSWMQWLCFLFILWGSLISYRFVKHLLNSLWQYIFDKDDTYIVIRNNHLAIEWLRAITSSLLFLLFFITPIPFETLLYVWIGGGFLWILTRIVVLGYPLSNVGKSLPYVFLYLCSQEILPLLYLGLGLRYVLSSEVFWAIYK